MARTRTEPPETDAGETRGFPSLADATPGPLALTGINQPLWLQNSTYPAAIDRQLIAAGLEPGVMGLGELAVTQRAAGANLSVDVAAGRVVVPMTDAPNQGSALCVSTAVNNLTVAGAPGAGLARIDLVIARVYDASLIGGSVNGWQLEIVTGTPAASPAAPATPASSFVLAQVAVAAGQVSVTTANITDRRVMPGIWRPYSPLWTSSNASPGLGNGSVQGRYMQRGKTCHMVARINFGSTSNGGSGLSYISLPVPSGSGIGAMEGTAVLFVPVSGSVFFKGVVYPMTVTTITALFPVTNDASYDLYWQNAAADGSSAGGVPLVAPNYPTQSGGWISFAATYETA
jgi:hypothetical protein